MASRKTKNVDVNFGITGADESKQDLNKIKTAVEQLGDDGKKSAQKLTDAFGNIEKASDKLNKKITEGKVITERDAKVMIQQFGPPRKADHRNVRFDG